MKKRREIDREIDIIFERLSNYADRYITRWTDVDEIEVKPGSPAVGRTLRDLKVRETTGATVVAVIRNGNEYFSPQADYVLRAGDILLVVSSKESKNKIESILK